MKRGFTLIELVMVIVILGVLAATAMPRFIDLSSKTRIAAARGAIGGIRAAIAIQYASNVANNITTNAGIPTAITPNMFQDNQIPEEPFSQSRAVVNSTGVPAKNSKVGGWFYDSQNGRVYINHSDYSMY